MEVALLHELNEMVGLDFGWLSLESK